MGVGSISKSPSILPFLERALTSVMYLLGSRAVEESFRLLKRQIHRQQIINFEISQLSSLLKCIIAAWWTV